MVLSHRLGPHQTLPHHRGDVAGGPAVRRQRGGFGVAGKRGRDVYEGCDSTFKPARPEARERGLGLEEEPISNAVFLLCG